MTATPDAPKTPAASEGEIAEGEIPGAEIAGAEIPGLGRRFGALLVDWLISVLVSAAFVDAFTATWQPVLALVVGHALFVGVLGQTPGMVLTRLRCISVTDGGPIGVPRALLRGILMALLVPAVVMDAWRRGLHDRAAGSIMVVAAPRG